MDYLVFFNIKEDPFRITPDSSYFFPSDEHNEMLSSLNYAIEQKEGFFLATGEPGTGKTTILKVFLNNLKNKAEVAFIVTPRLSPEEFLLAVLEDFGLDIKSTNKNHIIKTFREFLLTHSQAGRRVIIIVDEVQNLPDDTLEELRLLSNLETETEKLLQIVLIGQPEFAERLRSPSLRQLDQRITVRTKLKSLDSKETSDYINYRLLKAGPGPVIFEKGAKNMIHAYSKGIPRLINLLSSRALMAAYVDTSRTIHTKHVLYAVKNVFDNELRQKDRVKTVLKYAVLAMLVTLATVAIVQIFTNFPRFSDAKPKESLKQKTETAVAAQIKTEKKVIISKDVVNLRPKPTREVAPSSWALKGEAFTLLEEVVDATNMKWYKVKGDSGRQYWVAEDVVEIK